ncbi:MAG: hypothetical protein CMJ83_07940 [Planctomycetes bacterium]|nr:hypothetical protein [Planctomycetota bacterium]
MFLNRRLVAALAFICVVAASLSAQQHKELGRMWTFENAPLDFWKEAYGFSPSRPWLDRARLASLRYGDGCSASFVSPRGLIMTNNHCARGNVAKVSPEGKDWMKSGYFASTLAEEVPIPGLVVRQLVSMTNVTQQMNDGVAADADDEARTAKLKENRRAIMSAAKEKHEGLEPELVTLYQGGMYQVYVYKVFSDIRLVAFPHLQAAKFGGDPDNFTYPRFSLDYSFVRAWEDGKPADTSKFHFKWKTEGPTEGETVFVTGNPGSTGRLDTIAQMEFMRDALYPRQLSIIRRSLTNMNRQAKRNESPRLRNQILQYENMRKAFGGYLEGLENEAVMTVKRKAEKAIRERVAADENLKTKYADAWTNLEKICKEKTELVLEGRPTRAKMEAFDRKEAVEAKRIGEAFFAVYGTDIPPDATFTLRISDGVVTGFPCNGTVAPWFTSLYGLYARHHEFGGKAPFDLPDIWVKREKKLDLKTGFNLVSTCDIIGGNSGSPMINTKGEVVGLVFDGNIESLGNRFVFTDDVPRTVCVHPGIIIESLRKVYDRPKLADEIEGKGKGYK